MQSHRKMIVISVAVVISLLFLGAVALLIRGFVQFHEVETALQASKANLEMLYTQNPFPSSANRKQELENIKEIQQELLDLQSAMGAEQVEPVGQSPAKFITQFFDTKDRRLLVRAVDQNIKLPKGFDFGFGRHMKGDLPAPQDVPRLTQQLKIVETLCNLMFSCKITGLTAIFREEFEADALGGGGARPAPAGAGDGAMIRNVVEASAGIIPAGQLYGRWHFAFQFTGRDNAVMKILNALANSGVLVTITRLEINGDEKLFDRKEGPAEAARVVETAEGTPAVKEPPKSRDERVVCGREAVLTVKMELDVYQFAKPPAVDPDKKPGGVK
jgi:hypothetical protein